MKSSKGLTLIEILIALTIHAIFILMLGGTFYALLSFGNKSQQVLVAREHGRRVIDYVDSRIRNAGLGMWKLESYDDFKTALSPLMSNSTPRILYNLKMPVSVTWYDEDGFNYNKMYDKKEKVSGDIYQGNVLTLLYAEREDEDHDTKGGKDYAISLIIVPFNASGDLVESKDIKATETETVRFLAKNDKFNQYDKTFDTSTRHPTNNNADIRNWAVIRGSGIPLRVTKNSDKLNVTNFFKSDSYIYAGDELLYLNCERMFAEEPSDDDKKKGETVRNFKVQKLAEGSSIGWGNANPFESGILEIYMELHKDTNILDFYVLSTGGKDNTMTHDRPKDWPYTARPVESKEGDTEAWNKSKYCNDIVYVSRASWKLNNLCEGFVWD